MYYVSDKVDFVELLIPWQQQTLPVCSALGVYSSSSIVLCPRPRITCSMLVVTLETGVSLLFFRRWKCHSCFWTPTDGREKTTLLRWFYFVNFWTFIGMWSIIRQPKWWTENACFWLSLLMLFSFRVIQEEGRWFLILQRSPAGEPGRGWRHQPARLRSETECWPPALPRRQ